jgi:type II secretory ATPase GspE/PulE/Tfp pilus assembly ATPase PilB-like protein
LCQQSLVAGRIPENTREHTTSDVYLMREHRRLETFIRGGGQLAEYEEMDLEIHEDNQVCADSC